MPSKEKNRITKKASSPASLLLSVNIAPPFFLSELPSGVGNVLLFGLLLLGVTLALHKKYLPGALIVGLSLGVRLMAAFAR